MSFLKPLFIRHLIYFQDILRDVEKKALVSLDNNNIDFKLTDKIHDGKL